jgi:hypothetical protein
MSTASEKASPAIKPAVSEPSFENGARLPAASVEAPAADHNVAHLRARIAMLQQQLAEVVSCLENAETRAAEAQALQAKIAEYKATRSWRYTAPLRTGGTYIRHLLGR